MNNNFNLKKMTQLAIFIAIIIVMKITGLSSIPVGPLVMTFTMVPIAIGAMLIGPVGGAVLGFVYGLTSLSDAITGASAMTGFFFPDKSHTHNHSLRWNENTRRFIHRSYFQCN